MWNWFRNRHRAGSHLRELIDNSEPSGVADENRRKNRYVRWFPLLMAPVRDGAVDLDHLSMGIAKNISENGVGIVATQLVNCKIVFSFMVDDHLSFLTRCFLGEPCWNQHLVPDLYEQGFRVTRVLSSQDEIRISGFLAEVEARAQWEVGREFVRDLEHDLLAAVQ